MDNRPMLNAYPDSVGNRLSDMVELLQSEEFRDIFSSFYILPSLYNTDLDRGFSVIDYELNEMLVRSEDLEQIRKLGINLKLDFILNHASVLSKQFQDLIQKGEQSEYKDFFINWNEFWQGHGTMNDAGYIQPDPELTRDMFFRKPGLPILMVEMPDGRNVPYWNTFYQEVSFCPVDAQEIMKYADIQYAAASVLAKRVNEVLQEGKRPDEIDFSGFEAYETSVRSLLREHARYLGQMDLNIKSEKVWDFYAQTLKKLAGYGAQIVRLDAFAYASKEVGKKNFLNEPETWEILERLRKMAEPYQVALLPEIHASYEEKRYLEISEKGYATYDFFLPGLVIDALENQDGSVLAGWASEILEKQIQTVNMLGCHDGIPLLDLKGLIPEERIQKLIDVIVSRGGFVKDLHGQKNVYYQVNATFYSALGENDKKMLLARAIQLFMPGKPQIWYLDLFAGTNDHEAVKRAGEGGHKEINRTNLTMQQVKETLQKEVVREQLKMLRFRNTFAAFDPNAEIQVKNEGSHLTFIWQYQGSTAELNADLQNLSFSITGTDAAGNIIFSM